MLDQTLYESYAKVKPILIGIPEGNDKFGGDPAVNCCNWRSGHYLERDGTKDECGSRGEYFN
jgi:hypothetical protein